MALEIKQTLKLTQQLIMTPQLQQAIKLLQLSRLELLTAINQELEINPVLEESLEENDPESWEGLSEEPPEEIPPVEHSPAEITVESKMGDDFDWESYLEDKIPPSIRQERENKEFPAIENLSSITPSLKSHLLWQLQLAPVADDDRIIGVLIIGNIDEDGYLQAPVEERLKNCSGLSPKWSRC